MKNAKIFIVAICIALVVGCTSLPGVRDTPACPFRLDYVFSMEDGGEYISVTVTHIIVNQSEADLTVCNLPENFSYEWSPNLDYPDVGDGGVINEADIGTCRICCKFGMTTAINQFTIVPPGQKLVLGQQSFDISKKTTLLTYQASILPHGRDGRQFGLNVWRGRIVGSSITIPVRVVKADVLQEKKK